MGLQYVPRGDGPEGGVASEDPRVWVGLGVVMVGVGGGVMGGVAVVVGVTVVGGARQVAVILVAEGRWG